MRSTHDVVFLFDVDNTLLDNDRVTADLRAFLESLSEPRRRVRPPDLPGLHEEPPVGSGAPAATGGDPTVSPR